MSPAKEAEEACPPQAAPPPSSAPHPSSLDLSSMYQLPTNATPSSYHLKLAFHLPSRMYRGSVSTKLKINQPSSEIFLNSKNLDLEQISIVPDKSLEVNFGKNVKGKVTEIHKKNGVCRLTFEQELVPGDYILHIVFNGKIRSGLQGVYLNKFVDSEGDECDGVATMLAATEARSFFPCWDQPDAKCTFHLKILSHDDLVPLSNMTCDEEEVVEDHEDDMTKHFQPNTHRWKCFTFKRSPKMSTYLLCVVIGKFNCLSQQVGDTKISIYSPLHRTTEAQFSLDISAKCINIFNEFFGINYCLPKLDLIAISSLSVGAMENWGLIVFRENSLLVDPLIASGAQLQAVATIVAHEISHQWFGNLVTMSWWSDLWLNEGFATFMQYYATDKIFPEFKVWEQFCGDVLIPSLQLDALENSHPIKVKVSDPSEIDEIFDKISYRKGASVIRMLFSIMGEEKFGAGIRLYMNRYKYNNATTAQLWACLEACSNLQVEELMSCWVDNVGFPILKVSMKDPESGDSGPVICISQERFSAAHHCNEGLLWQVPLTVQVKATDSHSKESLNLPLLMMQGSNVEIPLEKSTQLDLLLGGYIKLNPGFVSYYRSEYSKPLSAALEMAVANMTLSPLDRLSTLEDRISLVLGEKGNTVALLKLVARMSGEDSYVVWKNLISFFHVLRCIVWSGDLIAEQFDRFAVSVMEPCLERIGWSKGTEEHHLVTMLRSLLICQLGTRGCSQVQSKCSDLLTGWLSGDKGGTDVSSAAVEPGLSEVVMKVAMSGSSSHQTFDQLVQLLDVPQERNRVLHSLGYSQNIDVLSRVLTFSLSPKLRDQEAVMVIESVCQNRLGIQLAWNFFKEHVKEFYDRYGNGLFLMSKLIKCVTENFSTEEKLTEVSDFLLSHPELGCERTIKQAKENIGLNLFWKNRDLDSVTKFLSESTVT